MAAVQQFRIGDFHMGKIGTKYFVYRGQWIKYLSVSDSVKGIGFDNVANEAYREVSEYCKSLNLPAPPKPKIQL